MRRQRHHLCPRLFSRRSRRAGALHRHRQPDLCSAHPHPPGLCHPTFFRIPFVPRHHTALLGAGPGPDLSPGSNWILRPDLYLLLPSAHGPRGQSGRTSALPAPPQAGKTTPTPLFRHSVPCSDGTGSLHCPPVSLYPVLLWIFHPILPLRSAADQLGPGLSSAHPGRGGWRGRLDTRRKPDSRPSGLAGQLSPAPSLRVPYGHL